MSEKEKKRALIVAIIIILLLLVWFLRNRFANPNRVITEESPVSDIAAPSVTVPDINIELPSLQYVPGQYEGTNYSGSGYVAGGCALCSFIGYNNLVPPSPVANDVIEQPQQIIPYIEEPMNIFAGNTGTYTAPSYGGGFIRLF